MLGFFYYFVQAAVLKYACVFCTLAVLARELLVLMRLLFFLFEIKPRDLHLASMVHYDHIKYLWRR